LSHLLLPLLGWLVALKLREGAVVKRGVAAAAETVLEVTRVARGGCPASWWAHPIQVRGPAIADQ